MITASRTNLPPPPWRHGLRYSSAAGRRSGHVDQTDQLGDHTAKSTNKRVALPNDWWLRSSWGSARSAHCAAVTTSTPAAVAEGHLHTLSRFHFILSTSGTAMPSAGVPDVRTLPEKACPTCQPNPRRCCQPVGRTWNARTASCYTKQCARIPVDDGARAPRCPPLPRGGPPAFRVVPVRGAALRVACSVKVTRAIRIGLTNKTPCG